MKRFFRSWLPTAIAAAALMLTTACTDNEIFSDGPSPEEAATAPDNAISFGTYMGRTTQTRAGATGSINTNILKGFKLDGTGYDANNAKKYGFGVFAYYTGIENYGHFQSKTYTGEEATEVNRTKHEANFMFNQLVWWDNSSETNGYITKWTYSPIKYWPNAVSNTDAGDDDQENDANTNPSFSTTANGKVSFFAYAPYVDFGNTAPTGLGATDGTKEGITAINTKTTLADANSEKTDPIISYKVASDAKNTVDLLWGTYGSTSKNVNDEGNAGVEHATETDTYKAAILEGYKLNADLTKQNTGGTVDFAFKHALAKVGGGSTTTVNTGTSPVNGLMVVLDIDDFKGAETGGEREKFKHTSDNDAYRTIVTIKDIKISNNLSGSGDDPSNITIGGTKYKGKDLKTNGKFNLATGQWDVTDASNSLVEQTIGTKEESSSKDDNEKYSAVLKESLREYHYWTGDPTTSKTYASEKTGDNIKDYFKIGTHDGVTEKAQNVFEDADASPLVFIPGQTPVLRFDVSYVVRTYDENLSKKYSEVDQTVSKIVTLPAVELNKQYNILIHIGLTSVKFTATVSDWDVNNETSNTDIDGDGTKDLEVTDVYVPRNVRGNQITSITLSAPNASLGKTAAANQAISVSLAWTDKAGTDQTAITNLSKFKFTSDADWLTFGGSGDTQTYSVTENTTGAARIAHVTVEYIGTETTFDNQAASGKQEFVITQAK